MSAERISDELDKLLVVDDPSDGLWFLVNTRLIDEFLPELPSMRLEQDPIHHHKDVLAHTIAVVANVAPRDAEGRPNRVTRLAALFHDVGKPRTRAITDGGVSFHHHEVVGARMTRTRMEALRYSATDTDTVQVANNTGPKIVVAGFTSGASGLDFGVSGFNADGSVATNFSANCGIW